MISTMLALAPGAPIESPTERRVFFLQARRSIEKESYKQSGRKWDCERSLGRDCIFLTWECGKTLKQAAPIGSANKRINEIFGVRHQP